MGQTVNLLVFTFGGSNPSLPTKSGGDTKHKLICGSSSVDRASAFQAEGREFEPRLPLNVLQYTLHKVYCLHGKKETLKQNIKVTF